MEKGVEKSLAGAPAEDGGYMQNPATLRQINDWNSYHHNQMMAMRPRRNLHFGMPSSSSGSNSWRKLQGKRFANFHDKHF